MDALCFNRQAQTVSALRWEKKWTGMLGVPETSERGESDGNKSANWGGGIKERWSKGGIENGADTWLCL